MGKVAAVAGLALGLGVWVTSGYGMRAAASGKTQVEQTRQDWPVYGGSAAQNHYSSLAQIDRKNVGQLKVAWTLDLGEKGNHSGSLQANPVVVGRVLYTFTPSLKVIALDAATGKLIWKFDSGIDGQQPSRGVTYWTDGKESRLFAGIMNYLYALDPATGKPIESFGENGRVDLRKGLRGNYRFQSVALTSPGVVYKDLIIVGGRNPEQKPSPPGDIRAFDVHTGALRWRFHTIPHPGEPGYETWPKDAWKNAGAANNWAGMTLDLQRGIVYVPTGSPVTDFYGADRLGNDLFADCLLALDASTGKLIWYFQGVHHDLWDRDFPSPPVLLTVKHDGQSIDAVAQTSKQGWVFLFDRMNGKPLFPIEEQKFPPSLVPGEVASPTQPVVLEPKAYARQRLTEKNLTNRTPEAHAWAVKEFRTMHSDGLFVPFDVGRQTVVFPGFDGGGEWGGPAVDPNTNVIYINSNDIVQSGSLAKNDLLAGLGASTYNSQCAVCHGTNRAGSPPTFPSLIGIYKQYNAEQITSIIHKGRGRMSSFPGLTGTRLDALLDYLRTGEDTGRAPEAPAKEVAPAKTEMAPVQPFAALPDANNPVQIAGGRVYHSQCAACHGESKEGAPPNVPALVGVGDRMTQQQVVDRIHQGKELMPAFPRLQGQDLESLLQYLGVGDAASGQDQENAEPEAAYSFTGYRRFDDPDGYPAVAPPWGTLNAIDLNTGRFLWKHPLGEYPELAAKGMKNTGSENYGGPVVTAGGVLIIAATSHDRKIRAFNSHNGKLLWEADLPFAGVATPSTYMVDGKQYVVIGTCGVRDPKGPQGAAYVAFALP